MPIAGVLMFGACWWAMLAAHAINTSAGWGMQQHALPRLRLQLWLVYYLLSTVLALSGPLRMQRCRSRCVGCTCRCC